ncbi:DUF4350 domain-containing protein [Sanguibacter sp. A247]|uniref:DUF4350 domain-containing protein n=1 Tax=unclassified Sanguibacter TaxID=2645534 RepID=UPI003FD8738B
MSSTTTPAGAPSVVVRDDATDTMGDGTTTRSRAASRWRQWRWPLLVVGVLILGIVLVTVLSPRRSTVPLDIDTATEHGARAVAQVLGRQGVDVVQTTSATDAVRRASDEATVAIVGDVPLGTDALTTLATTRADLVLIGADPAAVEHLTDGRVVEASSGTVATVPLDAGCTDPDAIAAGRIAVSGSTYTLEGAGQACFPVAQAAGVPASAAVVTVVLDDGRRITVLGSADLVTNGTVTHEGNAALALRTLGHHGDLVWFLPPASTTTSLPTGAPSLFDLLPSATRMLTLLAAITVLTAVFWRGRGLGPVVSEELPSEVRAIESTYGRGRLYRRAGARGHSAAALRAGAADRMARRVGLPRSTSGPALVDAIARATGRSPHEIAHVFHGPPPADDAAFAALIHQLDQLEREVDRS